MIPIVCFMQMHGIYNKLWALWLHIDASGISARIVLSGFWYFCPDSSVKRSLQRFLCKGYCWFAACNAVAFGVPASGAAACGAAACNTVAFGVPASGAAACGAAACGAAACGAAACGAAACSAVACGAAVCGAAAGIF